MNNLIVFIGIMLIAGFIVTFPVISTMLAVLFFMVQVP